MRRYSQQNAGLAVLDRVGNGTAGNCAGCRSGNRRNIGTHFDDRFRIVQGQNIGR